MREHKTRARIRVANRDLEVDVTEPGDRTPLQRLRIPALMWTAYGRVAARLGTNRAADLLDHVRQRIREHGDVQDIADLDAAEAELAERRARKGGRPRRSPTS